ncbi:MAG TPA: LTA synthase family protein [Candidatus Polarisedimenticolaceae bacterium]|nr:LTA synthase family protein [Candidatus Polarisedimenticolaceae bacterium]
MSGSSRLRLAAYVPFVFVVVGAVLRTLLYVGFHETFRAGDAVLALAVGALMDGLVGVLAALPFALCLSLFRLRWLERPALRFAALAAFGAVATFFATVEWYFFDEFNSRFNNIAVDYVRNPGEVLGNIHESYRVGLVAAGSVVAGLVLAAAGMRAMRGLTLPAPRRRDRVRRLAVTLVAATSAAGALALAPSDVSADRIVNEIAQNGVARFAHAVRTGNLDYALYYRTLPKNLARRRAAVVLDASWMGPDAETAAPPDPTPDTSPKPWDVVVILEESLGSEFIGALGHERKTPGFDRWSNEGLLLTNLTATGNRTVRGLEGTLCSMVPLPGAAVLKRMKHAPVATLAGVFQLEGYKTAFVYGGWGRFDDMKPFFPNNGFDEFIERDAYPKDAFSTVLGVADEWIFAQALARQKAAAAKGERLFMTVLTVSNHRPFQVPERGTAFPAARQNRDAAVAYADWALADYLDKARAEGLLDHTLVLIEGDHGARVYGEQVIPTPSYRIPGLFLVPDPAWKGRRLDRLASQIDLAPTLLALTGRDSPVPFLGTDLTDLPAEGGRAFVQHNRDVGLLTDTALVTLGLQHADICYTRSGRDSDAFTRAATCASSPALQSLEDDAAAVFQTADEMLRAGDYTIKKDAPSVAENR